MEKQVNGPKNTFATYNAFKVVYTVHQIYDLLGYLSSFYKHALEKQYWCASKRYVSAS